VASIGRNAAPESAPVPTFECAECHATISVASSACPNCAYPYNLVQGPREARAEDEEKTLWEGRSSFRGAFPALFRFVLGAALVVVVFEVGIARIPEWTCTFGAAEVCALVEDNHAEIEHVVEWARWAEIAIIGFMLIRLLITVIQVKRLHVRVTDERIVRQWGLVSRQVDEVDLRLVVDVSSRQNFFERIFNIGHIVVATQDPRRPTLDLRGLPDPMRLREIIRDNALGTGSHA